MSIKISIAATLAVTGLAGTTGALAHTDAHRAVAYERYCVSAHLPPNGQPTPEICVPKPI